MEALVDMREISLSTLEATGIVPHSEMSNDDATDHFEFFLRGAYYEITTQTFHKMQKLKNRSATKSTELANRSRLERIQLHLETIIKDLEIDNDIKDWGFDGFILSGIHQHPHRLPEAELRQISELFENFDGLNCLRVMQALLLLINLPRDKGGRETTSSAAPFVAAAASFWHSVKNGGGIDRRFKKAGVIWLFLSRSSGSFLRSCQRLGSRRSNPCARTKDPQPDPRLFSSPVGRGGFCFASKLWSRVPRALNALLSNDCGTSCKHCYMHNEGTASSYRHHTSGRD